MTDDLTPAQQAILTKGTEPAPGVLVGTEADPMNPVGPSVNSGASVLVAVQPTQVRRPWRATARTAFQAFAAMVVLFPILVEATGLDPEDAPWLAIPLAVAAGVARVMALPQVDQFLARFLPFLSAAGR